MVVPDSYRLRRSDLSRIRDVLSRPRYAAVGLAIGITAFSVYALLLNVPLLRTLALEGRFGLLATVVPGLVTGYVLTTTNVSLIMSVAISALIGVNFALVTFRILEMASFGRQGASSLGGMAVALVAPACPACATTIFAFAGLTSTFALLPFRGTELKVLALLLLVGSAVWIGRQIDKDTCRV